MATTVTLDISEVEKKLGELAKQSEQIAKIAANDAATEILRISQIIVPHNIGTLQNSGHVETESDGYAILGYNTVYAARLHEHPEYRFRNGRQGKYLENPIKENTAEILLIIGERISSIF